MRRRITDQATSLHQLLLILLFLLLLLLQKKIKNQDHPFLFFFVEASCFFINMIFFEERGLALSREIKGDEDADDEEDDIHQRMTKTIQVIHDQHHFWWSPSRLLFDDDDAPAEYLNRLTIFASLSSICLTHRRLKEITQWLHEYIPYRPKESKQLRERSRVTSFQCICVSLMLHLLIHFLIHFCLKPLFLSIFLDSVGNLIPHLNHHFILIPVFIILSSCPFGSQVFLVLSLTSFISSSFPLLVLLLLYFISFSYNSLENKMKKKMFSSNIFSKEEHWKKEENKRLCLENWEWFDQMKVKERRKVISHEEWQTDWLFVSWRETPKKEKKQSIPSRYVFFQSSNSKEVVQSISFKSRDFSPYKRSQEKIIILVTSTFAGIRLLSFLISTTSVKSVKSVILMRERELIDRQL